MDLFPKVSYYLSLSNWCTCAEDAVVGPLKFSLPGICAHPQQLWASAKHPFPKNGPQHIGKCLDEGTSPLNVSYSQYLLDTYKRPAPLPWGEIKLWYYAHSSGSSLPWVSNLAVYQFPQFLIGCFCFFWALSHLLKLLFLMLCFWETWSIDEIHQQHK